MFSRFRSIRVRHLCIGRLLLPLSLSAALQASGPVPCAQGAEGFADGGGSAPAADLLKNSVQLLTWLKLHSTDIAAASSRVAEARAEYHASRLLPNPTLSFSLGDINTGVSNPPGLGFSDTSIYTYVLGETAEIGKRGPRIASATEMLNSAFEMYLETLGQKAADARYAMGHVLYLRARTEALRESLGTARRLLDLEKTRFDQGEISGNDYDRLLLDTITLESDVARNEAEYIEALAVCRAALFTDCDVEGSEVEDLGSAVDLPEIPADESEALARRPDIRSMERQRDAAAMDLVLARRSRIPDPVIGIAYTHDNLTISGDQPNTLAFGLTLPLPIFDRGQHAAAKAEARRSEIEAMARNALVGARAELDGLLGRKRFLEVTTGSLEREALPRSTGILETTVKAFDQGQVGMTDLLLARRSHTNLLLSLLDLRFETFTVRNDLRRVLALDAEIARKSQVAGDLAEAHTDESTGG